MASPKLKNGYILINPKNIKNQEKIASTIEGAFKFGEKLGTSPLVDMVVEGSLAVDISGNRMGKGRRIRR
jgi:5-formyltetrahydrofolate cyclo-ligase